MNRGAGLYDRIPISAEEFQDVKSSGLTSPISMDMPLSEQRELNKGQGLEAMSSAFLPERPMTVSKKNIVDESESRANKSDQLRQFAKKIFKCHVTQAQNDLKTGQGNESSGNNQALTKVLERLIMHQKKNATKPEQQLTSGLMIEDPSERMKT